MTKPPTRQLRIAPAAEHDLAKIWAFIAEDSPKAATAFIAQIESKYTSEQCQRLMSEHGIQCALSRAGNVWDNAAMESFFSTLKTERTAGKVYRSRDAARADVFDYIERVYNPRRRHSTLGYLSPVAA